MAAFPALLLLFVLLPAAGASPFAPTCSCLCPTIPAHSCPYRCSECHAVRASCNCSTGCGFWEHCPRGYAVLSSTGEGCWLGARAVECSRDCRITTGQCLACRDGYYGRQCENRCPMGRHRTICSDHGDCSDGIHGSGKCHCDRYYAGPACEYSDMATCHSRGVVNDKGRCKCYDGFEGPGCLFSDGETCHQRGRVDAEGRCVCRGLWSGRYCERCQGVPFFTSCLTRTTAMAVAGCTVLSASLVGLCFYALARLARRPTPRAAAHLLPASPPSYNTFLEDASAATVRSTSPPETVSEATLRLSGDWSSDLARLDGSLDGSTTGVVRPLPVKHQPPAPVAPTLKLPLPLDGVAWRGPPPSAPSTASQGLIIEPSEAAQGGNPIAAPKARAPTRNGFRPPPHASAPPPSDPSSSSSFLPSLPNRLPSSAATSSPPPLPAPLS